MNEALETLMEARDHARARLQEHQAAIDALTSMQVKDGHITTHVIADEGAKDVSASGVQIRLGSAVSLRLSGERGCVIGLASYTRQPDQYLVEYVDAEGRQVEAWFFADALYLPG